VENGYTQGNGTRATRGNGILMWDRYRGVLGGFDTASQSECLGRTSRVRKLGSCADARMIEFGLFSYEVGREIQKDITHKTSTPTM